MSFRGKTPYQNNDALNTIIFFMLMIINCKISLYNQKNWWNINISFIALKLSVSATACNKLLIIIITSITRCFEIKMLQLY